jgi:outer membrane protein TolC
VKYFILPVTAALLAAVATSCKSPTTYRRDADQKAYHIIRHAQVQSLGEAQPFTIRPAEQNLRKALLISQDLAKSTEASLGTRHVEPIPQFPDTPYLAEPADDDATPPWVAAADSEPLKITLEQALMIAARNARDYQTQKEQVFVSALALDLERDRFRNTWASFLESQTIADLLGENTYGMENRAQLALTRRFRTGMLFTAQLGLDLVKLLSGSRSSSLGIFADASISIPLLRGSGEFVVTEPLQQAERNVVYAIYGFERFKQDFAVGIATDYLGVLEALDRVMNAQRNYENLIASTRRARRIADAGRLPEIQVDQALQDELRARDRWVSAQQAYERQLDQFKVQLGLPADAGVVLDPDELGRLATAAATLLQGSPEAAAAPPGQTPPADAPIVLQPPNPAEAGRYEIPYPRAIQLAIDHRVDLRVAIGRIFDSQRHVAVGADALRADLRLLGSASAGESRRLGSAGRPDAQLRFEEGRYSGLITIDLPLERTAERNVYRRTLIELERAVRDLQELEDRIKLELRNDLRTLLEARETVRIQAQAVQVAKRRVESTNLFLQAGRAEIRDVLEAQESLVAAENALTAAIVRYRVAELDLQADLGVLRIDATGLWQEFDPSRETPDVQS